MPKEYTHKGYTFRQTGTQTEVQHERTTKAGGTQIIKTFANLYEIEGIKPAGVRPWLTTVKDCKDFIDAYIDGEAAAPSWVGNRIRSARIRLGISQVELGTQLGYPEASAQQTITRWERGIRPVPIDKIKPLAELLGINPVDLLP